LRDLRPQRTLNEHVQALPNHPFFGQANGIVVVAC
jgi:hypothetical protein